MIEQHIEGVRPYNVYDMHIDKSSDGRYWYVLRWACGGDAVLRLRIQHLGMDEVHDFVAEIKIIDPADPLCGRGEEGFEPVGKFWIGSTDVAEQIEELRRSPEKWPKDQYPTVYGDEFLDMALLWEHILSLTHVGEALGTLAQVE